MKPNLILTSVKVDADTFDEFKIITIKTKFNLQKMVDKAMYLYVTSDEFRKQLHNVPELKPSGSI